MKLYNETCLFCEEPDIHAEEVGASSQRAFEDPSQPDKVNWYYVAGRQVRCMNCECRGPAAYRPIINHDWASADNAAMAEAKAGWQKLKERKP